MFFLFPLFFLLDSNKNRLALDVISRLMTHCCWLNVHIVQPHGVVFEIRVAKGYGARWSKDGSKVSALFSNYGFNLYPYSQSKVRHGPKLILLYALYLLWKKHLKDLIWLTIKWLCFLVEFQFIGFLEPYMEDGHSKAWKH